MLIALNKRNKGEFFLNLILKYAIKLCRKKDLVRQERKRNERKRNMETLHRLSKCERDTQSKCERNTKIILGKRDRYKERDSMKHTANE